jgi:hypothetical protein
MVHHLSDSDSDGSNKTDFLLSPSDSGHVSEDDDGGDDDDELGDYLQDLVRGSSQHGLSANATATQHAIDFDAALSSNAPKGKYGHKDNWDDIAREYKSKIAHAKLIKGKYGVPSPYACEHCASKDIAYRIYNPDLQAARATQGACGECRLRSNTCIVNGPKHRKSGRKRMASDVASNESEPKILRRSTGGDTRALGYCPVLSCPRRTEPFDNQANLLRHVTSAHPVYDASRLDLPRHISTASHHIASTAVTATPPGRTSRGMGTFVCPVVDCPNPTATRADNSRRHIRQEHSNSVHSRVLEAILKNTRITPGVFGHRPAVQWKAANPVMKLEFGHAKLIQGKYGVISPESCANCKKRRITCMLYQYVHFCKHIDLVPILTS